VNRRGWLLFGAMCVIWGIPYLMIRVAVREVTPAVLVFLRTGVSTAVLLPLAAHRGEVRPLLPRWRGLLTFATIEIAIPWILLSSAERRVSSSLAALLIAATPFVGVALAVTTGGERFGPRRLAGLLVGIIGVGAIVGLDLSRTSGVGLVEMAGVVVCYAVGPWFLNRYLTGLPSLGVIACSLAFTGLVYLPIAAFQLPSSLPSGRVIASIATLAVVCTAVAFVLFFELIAEGGPVSGNLITYVNPAVAALLGVLVLSERFTAGMGVGFVLVLGGSVLAAGRSRQAVAAEP
jgi:drug/metabolite transporter (DMT)-like permease